MATHKQTVRRLLDMAGTTFAEQAGVKLKNAPAPLYRLLVLSVLLSTRIKADIAVDAAQLLLDEYRGDLRRLREEAGGEPRRIRELLRKVPRLGPVGSDIFCREAQAIWPELRPAIDGKALDGAKRLNLPADPGKLARLVAADDLARPAAALVRVSLDKKLADQVL